MKERSNVFYCWLDCIAINEAHLMWGLRKFCKEFSNVGIFQSVFPNVPIMAVSITMTLNTFEYVQKTLNFKIPVHLY